jgi:hypothetical protein
MENSPILSESVFFSAIPTSLLIILPKLVFRNVLIFLPSFLETLSPKNAKNSVLNFCMEILQLMFVGYRLPVKPDFSPMTYQTGVSEYAQLQKEHTDNPHHEGALSNVQKTDSPTIPPEDAKSIAMPLLGSLKTHQQTDVFKTAHQDPTFTTIQGQ